MSKARPMTNATSLRGLTMKLYRQRTDGKAIYYTSNPDPNKSLWWVFRDRTANRCQYTVKRKHQVVCRDLTLKGEWRIAHNAPTLKDARDFITANHINP
jgi:hypothetical protein